MGYLDRATSSAVGGINHDTIQAMQRVVLAPQRHSPYYHLQYPAIVTNDTGWEVQCLADHAGWVNAMLDDQHRAVVFRTRKAAQDYMDSLANDAHLEYRVYPSFTATLKKVR